jgi:hypothetical protein
MGRTRSTPLMRKPWRLLLGLLCVALVLMMGTMAAIHTHTGHADQANCSLCVAAHMAVDVAAAPPQISVSPVDAKVETPVTVVRAQTRCRSALFTRPPPVMAALS